MAEFSFSQCPQWSSLDAWRGVLPNGDGVLLDPATGRPANGRYEWLEADPRLQAGSRFLLEHSGDVHLTVVLGIHGEDDSDALACSTIAESDIAGIEGLLLPAEDGEIIESEVLGPPRLLSKLRAAKHGKTPVFCYDPPGNSPVELDCLINGILAEPMPGSQELPVVERLEWKLAIDAFREHYILGSYGNHLKNRWHLLGSRPVRAALTIGLGHPNIPDYFEVSRVRVTPLIEPSHVDGYVMQQAQRLFDQYAQIMRTGIIPAVLRAPE